MSGPRYRRTVTQTLCSAAIRRTNTRSAGRPGDITAGHPSGRSTQRWPSVSVRTQRNSPGIHQLIYGCASGFKLQKAVMEGWTTSVQMIWLLRWNS